MLALFPGSVSTVLVRGEVLLFRSRAIPAITRDHGDLPSLDHHAIHAKDALLGFALGDRFRLQQRSAFPPEVFKLALVARAIEMEQISLIGGGVVGKPL